MPCPRPVRRARAAIAVTGLPGGDAVEIDALMEPS
jgi:hypothetical protein